MARRPASAALTEWGSLLAGAVLLGLLGCGKAAPAQAPDALVCGHPKRQQALGEVHAQTQCGPTLDFTPVNSYQGDLSDIMDREDAVALLDGRCTGTLVQAAAGPVVLTAGHCTALGDRVLAVFNFEDAPDGDPLMTEGTVIEQSMDPDYALIQLDQLPHVTPLQLTSLPTERLAIIQHPRGHPKVVAEGWYEDACDDLVYYSDLDTLVGSSGAAILNRHGYVLGVHTDGDCDEQGHGTNRGWSAKTVVAASPYLQDSDIAER
ncbi:trypsin-like peptidase domain-containing protein [Aggregicoccus sp. 17bor-14]|uniref:trypsin-like serine peptidase n=1 Tax=Myxococcaceae TaxID=31 RepID=UPI00129C268B|nr:MULTISPECIES: serine protease [Myxococcaceae]MBF5045790.1 trypsin-like peptidase domain-containing protein [Simulacricoccus sp. 17bor-14]MRI91525.1 trypsin-like peptidase domain-containing protein [Aggregicoccus sp. 17bor-14]